MPQRLITEPRLRHWTLFVSLILVFSFSILAYYLYEQGQRRASFYKGRDYTCALLDRKFDSLADTERAELAQGLEVLARPEYRLPPGVTRHDLRISIERRRTKIKLLDAPVCP